MKTNYVPGTLKKIPDLPTLDANFVSNYRVYSMNNAGFLTGVAGTTLHNCILNTYVSFIS